MVTSRDQRAGGQRGLTVAGYLVLFLLGAAQGLVGTFQFSRPPSPLIAIVFVVVIFATCVGCGWGVGTAAAGFLPAAGWIIVSFILSMPRPNGSLLLPATAAAEWYLYGGALACLAGAVSSFFIRLRRPAPPR